MIFSAKSAILFVGTYTDKVDSKGVYTLRFDLETGAIKQLHAGPKVDSPSFLATSHDGSFLYAVNETTSGEVTSFMIDKTDGSLSIQSSQKSLGVHPCHISLDKSGMHALVANYSSGTVTSLPINRDGSLAPGTSVQQKGTGPNKARQEAAHAHSVTMDPSGQWYLAADLGADKVFVYTVNSAGHLVYHPKSIALPPGCGPRHVAFHPNGKFLYVIGELDNTVTSFSWNAVAGSAKKLSTASTLPAGFSGDSNCADIHVHPNGRFIYGSNRGHDSIAILRTDTKSGSVTFVGTEGVRGKTPRNFAIAPGGKFLLAAGQNSNNIVVFKIDAITGGLMATGIDITIPSPVCLVFLSVP